MKTCNIPVPSKPGKISQGAAAAASVSPALPAPRQLLLQIRRT